MLRRVSRPERLLLGPTFSIFLSVCALAVMGFGGDGAEKWIVMLLSVALGVISTVQIRARALFKGANYPVLATFMLLQATSVQSLSGCLLTTYALLTTLVLFFCFLQPQLTRVYFLLFLFTGSASFFSPQWILWGVVSLALMVTVRAFSLRGLVASLLGLVTPFIVIPVAMVAVSRSLEPLFTLAQPFLQVQFVFSGQPSEAYMFSATVCVLFALASFLTAYGYPAKARARNMSVYVISGGALLFPWICADGASLWLPLLNLCAAYHCGHFIATKRSGWVVAIILWMFILTFIGKQLCIF